MTVPVADPRPQILQHREDPGLPARIAVSAAVDRGVGTPTVDVPDWLAECGSAGEFRVTPIPFDAMEGWSFHEETGDLVHHTGRFFQVQGLHAEVSDGLVPEWQQPIINQPEVGILGILAKSFDGVLHFLMQAKMEPGNPNLLQISPTVQATRSNYTKVHRGADVKYLEYFRGTGRGRVLVDVLQSEHGAWFFRKSNRNMIVETTEDVPLEPGFRWMPLGEIGRLLREDLLINMDSRTVLACAPVTYTESGAVLSDTELVSWFTAEQARRDLTVRRIPLSRVEGWTRTPWSIEREDGQFFRVTAVSVDARSRETAHWTQPLFAPVRRAMSAFLTRRFEAVPHVLVHAKVEGGVLSKVELAPTVQCTPEYYSDPAQIPFLDAVTRADPSRVRYEAVHSEEGGRFYHAAGTYRIVEADESTAPTTPPPGFAWVTPGQLNTLVRHGHYVNVQARTLLACLNSGAVTL